MTIGITVNVGLNSVTSTVFSANPLQGCEKDAIAMFEIAKDRGFDMNLSKPPLLGAGATHANVTKRVLDAAEVLKPGDLFFFSFAGHGTFEFIDFTINEDNADDPEDLADRRDESIVLTDHYMTDNYWRKELWPQFKEGVRVIAIADCCHSRTVLSLPQRAQALGPELASAGLPGSRVEGVRAPFRATGSWEDVQPKVPSRESGLPPPRFRMITMEQGAKELEVFEEFYTRQNAAPAKKINASRLFLSACEDDQKAADGEDNGAFTAALLKVWNNGNFEGNYNDLMEKVRAQFLGTNQTPTLRQIGNPDVSSEKPFTI